RCEEASVGEHALDRAALFGARPLEGFEVFEAGGVYRPVRANVEIARPIVLERRQCRVLGKDFRRLRKGEGGAVSHAARHLADDPPVGARVARWREEGTLARDAPLRIGHRAALLAPTAGR